MCDRLGQLSVSENVTLRDVVRQYGLDNVVGLIDDLNEILRENKSSISAKAIEPKLYIIKISSLEVHTETNNAYRPCSGFMVAKVGKTEQFGTKRCDLIIAGLKKLGYEANLFKTSHAHEHESEKDYREKLAVFSVPYELLKKLGFDYTWGLTEYVVMNSDGTFPTQTQKNQDLFIFDKCNRQLYTKKGDAIDTPDLVDTPVNCVNCGKSDDISKYFKCKQCHEYHCSVCVSFCGHVCFYCAGDECARCKNNFCSECVKQLDGCECCVCDSEKCRSYCDDCEKYFCSSHKGHTC